MATKSAQLERLLAGLQGGKFTDDQLKTLVFSDIDGNTVRLNAPDAVEKLTARIESARAFERAANGSQ
jgi:hypothetical protein